MEQHPVAGQQEFGMTAVGQSVGSGRGRIPDRAVAGQADPPPGAAWDILLEAAVRLAQSGVPMAWRKLCGSPHGRVISLQIGRAHV